MIEDWTDEIQKVAKKAANDWPGVIKAEDLAQDIVVKILEAPGTVRDLSEMGSTSRYQTLHKIAQRIASQERSDYELFTGDFRYSVDEVRSLLESSADPDSSEMGSSWSVGGQTRSSGEHSDSTGSTGLGNIQVSEARGQLSQALAGLRASNTRQYDALVRRFVYGEKPDRTDIAAFRMIDRALTSITTRMNHGHKRRHVGDPEPYKSLGDGPGTRRVIRNSTARYLTKEGYDADYMPAPTPQRDNHVEAEVW